ncbi:MAG TPA: alpha/beta fold hydrolase [Aeromicrobium sp.]|nr:alpha/beta fold hydrolase [Aeromicrobium sp.]
MRLIRRFAIAATTLAAVSLSLQAPANAAWVNPFPHSIKFGALGQDNSFPAALGTSILNPDKAPAGANDWKCKPSKQHPNPVVLVHGTWENAYNNWNGLSPILKDKGYCVFAPNVGQTTGIKFLNGTGDMIESSAEVGAYVDKVLAATGAKEVDLIGHSQGGALIRYYTNLLGGAPKVNQVIALSPSNHPTTMSGITELGKTLKLLGVAMDLLELVKMPAAAQQADKSPGEQSLFYRNVNGPAGETIAGENYTTINTKNDEIVTPYTSGEIKAVPGAKVDNITIQNVCKNDNSEHLSLAYSKNVAQIVLNKLDPSDQHRIWCYSQSALFGNTQLIG